MKANKPNDSLCNMLIHVTKAESENLGWCDATRLQFTRQDHVSHRLYYVGVRTDAHTVSLFLFPFALTHTACSLDGFNKCLSASQQCFSLTTNQHQPDFSAQKPTSEHADNLNKRLLNYQSDYFLSPLKSATRDLYTWFARLFINDLPLVKSQHGTRKIG